MWKKRECRKCDLTSDDSRCYTWSDSLPLQLCRPHAQYDFTTSSPSLEILFLNFFLHAAPSPSPLLSICPDAVLTDRQVKSLVTCLWLTVASVGWQGLTKRPRQSSVYETFSAAAAAIITYRSFILPSLATARYTHAPVTQRSFSAPVLDFCPKVCVCL